MQVVAKFHCDQVADRANQYSSNYTQRNIELSVVSGLKPEDAPFTSTTPGGEIKLTLSQAASDEVKVFFKPGKKYHVKFEEVEEGE